MTEQANKTEQLQAWVREQFQKANKHMAERGVLPGKVVLGESRYMPGLVAVWKIEEQGPKKQRYWLLTGDLPTDMVSESAATDAREVVRHFALSWQLKAENLLNGQDKTQRKFAQLLIGRAEGLSKLHEQDQLWADMPMVK